MYFLPLFDQFYQAFKACWSFCSEPKVVNESYSMSWVCCAFGNVQFLGRMSKHFFNLSIIIHNRNWARPTSHLQRGLAGSPGGCCWGWTGLAESPRSSEEPSAPSPLVQLALHLQGGTVECFFLGWNSETSTNHGLVGIWGWSSRWTLGAGLVVALPVLKSNFGKSSHMKSKISATHCEIAYSQLFTACAAGPFDLILE